MSEQAHKREVDFKFILVCGVLLLMIVVALFWLWQLERSRREQLEQALAAQLREPPGPQLPPEMEEFIRSGASRLVLPLQREDLAERTVQLDGRSVRALEVPAQAGQRVGLEPGDVLIVQDQPATAPGTGDR